MISSRTIGGGKNGAYYYDCCLSGKWCDDLQNKAMAMINEYLDKNLLLQ
jgi:hypothetical protein